MKALLQILPWIIVGLLGAGYLASLNAAFSGTAMDYAARIDVPQVSFLALLLLGLCIGLGFRPNRGDEEDGE